MFYEVLRTNLFVVDHYDGYDGGLDGAENTFYDATSKGSRCSFPLSHRTKSAVRSVFNIENLPITWVCEHRLFGNKI